MVVWQFSSDFADNQRDRVERLTAWRAYGEIVDAVIATSVVAPRSVIWKQRNKAPTEAYRIEFKVDADRDAVDALFNSAQGKRGKFAASIRSLHASRAKVWVVQKRDLRLHPAITGKGPTSPSIDIRYQPWLDRVDDVVETSHGARWLARGGVLAFRVGGCLIFKGGWILDGQCRPDLDKDARSDQLHCYAFS